MAWTMEQAYPIFLDVVLCVNLTELFLSKCMCIYFDLYLLACIQVIINNQGKTL